MPNTLAHLGVQTLLTRVGLPGADARWIALGCVLPDLPWIAGRVLAAAGLTPDPVDARLYFVAQSSLLVSLCLVGALAALSAQWRTTGAVLAVGCALHLGLDALQIKWGNGVLLLAPFSFSPWSLGIAWPDSVASYALTALGVAVVWREWRRGLPRGALLRWSRRRAAIAAALAAAYLVLPWWWMSDVRDANAHYAATLDARAERAGRYLELDRVPLEGDRVRIYTGDSLACRGACPDDDGLVSLRGRFVDAETLAVEAHRFHTPWIRDLSSIVGLAVVGWWLWPVTGRGVGPPARAAREPG